MVSLYLAGPVDFNEKTYYDVIEGLLDGKVPVTLFRPGMAFKVKGDVDPNYLVSVNMEAMLRADIVVFYLNNSKTCGMWMEAVWALKEKKRMIFYVEPGVRLSLYMRWLVDQVKSEWITDIKDFWKALNEQVLHIYKNKQLNNIFDVFPLGEELNLQEGDYNE